MKVTAFIVIILVNALYACRSNNPDFDELVFQQKVDSIASKRIDSAYKQIQQQCDTARKYRIPVLVDSILKIDTINQ